MDGNEKLILRALKIEIKRNPRARCGFHRNGMNRINYLISCAEKRLKGLRPLSCGSKGSGHISGYTNTLPLHVEILYNEY